MAEEVKISALMMEKFGNFLNFLENELGAHKFLFDADKVEEMQRKIDEKRRMTWGQLLVVINQFVMPYRTAIKDKDDSLIGVVAGFFPEVELLVNPLTMNEDADEREIRLAKIDKVWRYLDFFCDCVAEVNTKNDERAGRD